MSCGATIAPAGVSPKPNSSDCRSSRLDDPPGQSSAQAELVDVRPLIGGCRAASGIDSQSSGEGTPMELGPVELVVLTFPGERADPDVVSAVAKVVSQGYVTVLDLVFISRLQDGQIRITDVDENLDDIGFGSLEIKAQTLVNEDDMEVIRDSLEPGTSAAIIVYEESWARGVASAVRKAGGEVALHVQVPRDAVDAAVAAAASAD